MFVQQTALRPLNPQLLVLEDAQIALVQPKNQALSGYPTRGQPARAAIDASN